MLLLGISCKSESEPLQIDLWYGNKQVFGYHGLSQKWVNILGNIESVNGIRSLTYKINGGEEKIVSLGSDLHRLASQGDFNLDIDTLFLNEGINQVEIKATDSLSNSVSELVELELFKNKKWTLPYSICWDSVENIQQAVQVVDGKWIVQKDGVSNQDRYYDRVIAIGDNTWENYEVETTVKLHGYTTPVQGPPTYKVTHFAIACRWNGHDVDSLQPHRKWYPLGATAEFRVFDDSEQWRWRVFSGPKTDGPFYIEQPDSVFKSLVFEELYKMKHRVQTIGQDSTLYSVKLWSAHQPEPLEWDLSGIETFENEPSGSALLLAHHTSVTFGDIKVSKIK